MFLRRLAGSFKGLWGPTFHYYNTRAVGKGRTTTYPKKNYCYATLSSSTKKSSKGGDDNNEKESNGVDPIKINPYLDSESSKRNKGLGDPERVYFDPALQEIQPDPEDEEDVELCPPTNCCRTGCPNCVWIEYVEKLTNRYLDPRLSKQKVIKDLEEIDDESIKAFIKLELRSRGLL